MKRPSFVMAFFRNHTNFIISAIISVVLFFFYISYSRNIFHAIQQLFLTSQEDRKGRMYASYGYDYVKRVISIIPQPWIFPVVRYVNYAHNVDIVLPVNSKKTDGRVLIGINLPKEALQEELMTTAHRITKYSDGNTSYWVFNTIDDYDTLTAFHFLMRSDSEFLPVNITLFANSSKTTVLGSWIFEPIQNRGNQTIFTLPVPIKNFSFNRGSEDFLIALEQPKDVDKNMFSNIEYIRIYGIKVDLERYHIVHRSDRNFTALTYDFLHTIEEEDLKDWKQFLSKIHQ